jgi:hypothetical protein
MGSNAQEASTLAMLSMLEERLHRLEFILHGTSNSSGIPDPAPAPSTRDDTVSARLANVESNLRRLASRHGVVQNVLDLRMKFNDFELVATY